MNQIVPRLLLLLLLLAGVSFGIIDPISASALGMALTTSTAQLGNGATLEISSGSPTSYLTINNATNIAFNNGTSAEVDVTNLTSSWKEFLLGLPDGGTLTADIHTDMGDAGQAAAYAAKNSRIACDIRVVLPAGTTPTWTARGFVKKFDLMLGVDAPVKTGFEFRVTGPWTAA